MERTDLLYNDSYGTDKTLTGDNDFKDLIKNLSQSIDQWLDTKIFEGTVRMLVNNYNDGLLSKEVYDVIPIQIISSFFQVNEWLQNTVSIDVFSLAPLSGEGMLDEQIAKSYLDTHVIITRRGVLTLPKKVTNLIQEIATAVEQIALVGTETLDTIGVFAKTIGTLNLMEFKLVNIFVGINEGLALGNREKIHNQKKIIAAMKKEVQACKTLAKTTNSSYVDGLCTVRLQLNQSIEKLKSLKKKLYADPLVLGLFLAFYFWFVTIGYLQLLEKLFKGKPVKLEDFFLAITILFDPESSLNKNIKDFVKLTEQLNKSADFFNIFNMSAEEFIYSEYNPLYLYIYQITDLINAANTFGKNIGNISKAAGSLLQYFASVDQTTGQQKNSALEQALDVMDKYADLCLDILNVGSQVNIRSEEEIKKAAKDQTKPLSEYSTYVKQEQLEKQLTEQLYQQPEMKEKTITVNFEKKKGRGLNNG